MCKYPKNILNLQKIYIIKMRNDLFIHTHAVNNSYWEIKQYFTCFDLVVIGSGIVGLNTAFAYKKAHPKASVLVLEKGTLPSGASTKNAGFACFGSPSELLADLRKMPEKAVWETLQMRWEGLKLLKKNLGKKRIQYKNWGGYELFKDKKSYEYCSDNLTLLNQKIKDHTGIKNTFSDGSKKIKTFGFSQLNGMILSKHEGQLDTGLMMDELLSLVQEHGIKILNNINVKHLNDTGSMVEIESEFGVFKAKKVVVAINGFAKKLLKIKDVNPARAQVLLAQPSKKIKFKGTFHYDEGFYYFRNIDGYILLGGGRNLDIKGETTDEIAITNKIQFSLENLLKTVIIPQQKFKILHRWAGIMGVGNEKKPIIKHYTKNIVCAIRMGGMGVAIGSLVGEKAAKLVHQK